MNKENTKLKELSNIINKNRKFKSDEEFTTYLLNFLKDYNLVDLLEKLVCLRFFIQTDRLQCDETNRDYFRNIFNVSFCFLYPFLLHYKVEHGNIKIRFNDLFLICKIIVEHITVSEFIDSQYFCKENIGKIDYIQNNLTDLIGQFKKVPTSIVLNCESELIKEKYNVSTKDIVDELIEIFTNKIYVFMKEEMVDISKFVDNFEIYINTDNFIVSKECKSYTLCHDLSTEFGSLSNEKFSFKNPLSIINLSRKIFLKYNGLIYNLCDDLICGRLNRSIESLFTSKNEKDKWRQNYKTGTEGLLKEVMEHYLPCGKYYENNYYKDSNGNICENDGIYDYYNFLFCIEIKGNKFNPDSIRENVEKVDKSYNEVIEKAKSQVVRLKEKLNGQTSFNILNSDGSVKCKIEGIENKKIICICVYFEDIGTLLAGLSSNEDNTIHISFYDLFLVFNFLVNPFLISKYLYERSLPLNEKRFYLNDELTFLSMFRTNIHLNYFLNSVKIPFSDDSNVKNIFFCNEDFGSEIEIYFLNGKNKPPIEINNFIGRLITYQDFSVLDDNLFGAIYYLLDQNDAHLNNLEIAFNERNKGNTRKPLSLILNNKEERFFALIFISRGHNPYQKKQNLAYVKKYFKCREYLDVIYLLEIGKDYTEVKKINKNSKLLNNIDDVALLPDISFKVSEKINLE